MYLKHFLSLLALLVFVLPSCKKDLISEKPILDYQVNFHERQKSGLQEMFFSKGRMESMNPNIHEGLEKRSNADLESVLHALLDQDEEQHFIPALIHDLGLPLWDSYYKFTGGSGGKILYFIPMAFDHSTVSTGYIMAFEASDGEVKIDVVSREFVEALLSDDTAVDSYVNMAGSVLMTLIYDDQLFANPDTAYLQWLWDHYEDLSQDSTGAFLEERGVCTITICYHVTSVSGYQSGSTGWSYPAYGNFNVSQNADQHCYDIYICPFDTNFSGWDPSDNPWNSGSNTGGSGGDSPGQDYQEFQETCFLYNLTETEPDIQVNIPGGYNESMSATCHLFENIKDCFDEMGFTGQGSTQLLHWLTSHPDGIDLMAYLNFRKGDGSCEVFSEMPWLRSYADLLKEEGEVMDMRAYNMLYNKVYNDLIPQLGLDPVVDGAWLMEHPEVVAQITGYFNFLPETTDDIGTVNAILDYQMATEYATEAEKMQSLGMLLASEMDKVLLAEGIDWPTAPGGFTDDFWNIVWEVMVQTVPDLLPIIGEAIEFKNAVISFNNGDYWQSTQHLSFAVLGIVGLDKVKDVYKFVKGVKSAWKVFKLVKKLRLWAFSDEAVKGFIKVGLHPNKLNNHIFRIAPGHMPDLQPLINATGGKLESLEAVYKKLHDLGHLDPSTMPVNTDLPEVDLLLQGLTLRVHRRRVFQNGETWIEVPTFYIP